MSKAAVKEDKLANAKAQGQAQFDSIKEMVEALQVANQDEDDTHGCKADEARTRIEEDALSVQVRSGWYQPGASKEDRDPYEYEILLCTGGPACRIVGDLSEHCEPCSARIEVQDWFTPWTEYRPKVGPDDHNSEPILLAYAACFWFGEG